MTRRIWLPEGERRIWTPADGPRGMRRGQAPYAWGAVARDADITFDAENNGADTDRSVSFSLTIDDRADRLVLVCTATLDSVAFGTHSVTVGGQACTQLVAVESGMAKLALHARVAPLTGSQTVACDAGTDTTTTFQVCAVSLWGCKQILPTVFDSSSTTVTSLAESFTSTLPCWVIDAVRVSADVTTVSPTGTGQILRSSNVTSTSIGMSSQPHPTAAARSLGYTWGGESRTCRWCACQVLAA